MGTRELRIGFVGAGTVGKALAACLTRRGYDVVAVASRRRESADQLADLVGARSVDYPCEVAEEADLVFVTTPDDAIAGVVTEVSERRGWRLGHAVVHCSGALTSRALDAARRDGARIASMHPLQSFATYDQALENLPGSVFGLEGDPDLVSVLKELVLALDGRPLELSAGNKTLYHAAACIASNYTVTLANMAAGILEGLGLKHEDASAALLPLLRGTLNNLETIGLPDALTGPIARGDLGTLRAHVDELSAQRPELLEPYCELGMQTVPVSLEKGKIGLGRAREMIELFEQHQDGFCQERLARWK